MPGLLLLQCVGIRYKISYSKMQGTGKTSFQLLPEGFACLKPSRRVHWVVAMLQAEVFLLRHTQVAIGHIQKRLAQILFVNFKGLYQAI